MIIYTKRYVNIVSLLISIIIFILLNQVTPLFNKIYFKLHPISIIFKMNPILVELSSNNINQSTKENLENQSNYPIANIEENNWKIIIPKISLEANISEGTSKEIMDKYVGHFEETSLKSGNIGLAAHNRGYEVNYFADIKYLKEGDEIIYKHYDFEKIYTVVENKIIKDTDWKDLQPTEENKITLITCVENEPEYRRCIQGIEKLED